MDLSVDFLGKKFKNPFVLASGVPGSGNDKLVIFEKAGAGGITIKSVSPKERIQNPPAIISRFDAGLINAVGLPCPPLEKSFEHVSFLKKSVKIPVIASVVGINVKEFVEAALKMEETKADLIELDMSCPHVKESMGVPFAMSASRAEKLVKAVKKEISIPFSAKLSPNAPDILEIAKACEKAGADALTAVNSLGPGMIINTKTAKPVLSNKYGGVTGPALRPVAVRCVHQIFEKVKIPIIGTGGITYGKDAVEMLMAGATLLGVGTAVYTRGNNVFEKLEKELIEEMKMLKFENVAKITGFAHKQ